MKLKFYCNIYVLLEKKTKLSSNIALNKYQISGLKERLEYILLIKKKDIIGLILIKKYFEIPNFFSLYF